jgi:hypothetical protein
VVRILGLVVLQHRQLGFVGADQGPISELAARGRPALR